MARNPAAGRKAAPPELRLLKGRGEGKDSAGRKVEEPPPFARELPTKPSKLSADADWMWEQVIGQMRTVGVLKPLDAAGLEVACETFARWREAVRFRQEHALLAKNSQGTVAAPWIGIEERAGRDFRTWCAEFGFTPAAEKNLIADTSGNGGLPGGGANPFA